MRFVLVSRVADDILKNRESRSKGELKGTQKKKKKVDKFALIIWLY